MTRYLLLLLTATAALAVTSAPASACGESLFRVGKGAHYRQYIAPLPGNILMVARSENERRIADWLSKAGHNVQVVDDPARLQLYLKDGDFDIVMAYFMDRDLVETEAALSHSDAKYLPVVSEQSGKVPEARSRYRQLLTERDFTPKTLLKTIHRTLKSDGNKIASIEPST